MVLKADQLYNEVQFEGVVNQSRESNETCKIVELDASVYHSSAQAHRQSRCSSHLTKITDGIKS